MQRARVSDAGRAGIRRALVGVDRWGTSKYPSKELAGSSPAESAATSSEIDVIATCTGMVAAHRSEVSISTSYGPHPRSYFPRDYAWSPEPLW